ncbi:MAG: YkgJ family cysteine cluster protein [Nitrospiraceae bacterium]|nr:YkgJ family cysteine cluster protein [Nitrospiraceae bacterium]
MTEDPLVRDLTYSNVRGETFTLSQSLYRESLEALGRIGERIGEGKNRVSPGEALSMLREIYRIVDRVGESVSGHMSCSAGCAACCRMMVGVTRGEGEILRERVDREPEGERKDRWRTGLLARTETLLSMEGSADPSRPLSTLSDMLATCEAYEGKGLFCPFLGADRLCEIYEDRPLMCRICWTLTDPRDCDPGEGPPVKFRNGVFFRAFDLVILLGKAGYSDPRHRPIPLWLTLA